ncbi:MAG: hypothetical protein KBI47_22200 [Armatimonadetes bacterium]|nr:hypothetical protein [Armatimonadota bacterium]
MANVRCANDQSREHIVDRLVERLYGRDDGCRSQAETLLDKSIAALCEQAPNDWRFTRHPSACFFVSLLVDCPATGGKPARPGHAKLLGASFRESDAGRELEHKLAKYVEAHCGCEQLDGRDSLTELAELYLVDLETAGSKIVHEVRTAYFPDAAIGQRRTSTENRLAEFPHTAIMRSVRSPATRAAMPNAILCRPQEDPETLQLLVRQGESWTRVHRGGKGEKLYALFVPLTSQGIQTECGAIWSFDERGKLAREAEGVAIGVLGAGWAGKPDGYRNETYWMLPTRLDVLRMDLDYMRREKAHCLTAAECLTVQAVDWITDLALGAIGLQPKPTWAVKNEK